LRSPLIPAASDSIDALEKALIEQYGFGDIHKTV
jgi:hypothetical protein